MDQRVNTTKKFYNPYRVINLHDTDKEGVCFAGPWAQAKGKDCLPLL